MTLDLCLCQSELEAKVCCLPLLQGKKKAPTAEALLRSRYVAFVRGDIDYILKTHHSKTIKDVDRKSVEDWSKNSEWMGLKVVSTQAGMESDDQGAVTFHVQYREKDSGKVQDHHEYAVFEKDAGEWRFLDAQAAHPGTIRRAEPKIGRNDPCACGSGKKFKKCCAVA